MANPHDARVHRDLVQADALRRGGRLPEAEKAVRAILRKEPRSPLAWLVLAKVHAARGEFAAAEQAYGRSIAIDADAFEARVNLGVLLGQRGAAEEAAVQLRAALRHDPNHPLVLRNLGGVLRSTGELDEALQLLERSLSLDPNDAGVHSNLGLVCSSLGLHARALPHLERAVALAPAELSYYDNLLMLMHYSSECDCDTIFAAHRRYGEVAAQLARPLSPQARRPLDGRKLRVGFVSADLRKHSVAFFLEPLLEHLDRERFELHAYSASRVSDEVTARLRPHFSTFTEAAGLDDDALAAQLRRDALDVLVDLGGHTQGNRLGAFARKPTPVQLTYLGYPNTTGLASIDFRLTDAWADPGPADDALHTERLLRLESGFLSYRPPAQSPDVAPPPSTTGAAPTFGSFNALAKLSERTLALWSRLLAETPEARLLLKESFLSRPATRRLVEQRLVGHGIALDRVVLLGHVAALDGHLAAYGQVDVALDSFPYNGTTTTCDALWMGVPVVTLAGDAHVSRVGVSLLSRLGLSEHIALSDDDYVQKARDLLRDTPRRVDLRASARERLLRSGITDGARVTRAFEAALLAAFEAGAVVPSKP